MEAFRPLAVPRMNILNTVEREALESPPGFNSVQRKQYFASHSLFQSEYRTGKSVGLIAKVAKSSSWS